MQLLFGCFVLLNVALWPQARTVPWVTVKYWRRSCPICLRVSCSGLDSGFGKSACSFSKDSGVNSVTSAKDSIGYAFHIAAHLIVFDSVV